MMLEGSSKVGEVYPEHASSKSTSHVLAAGPHLLALAKAALRLLVALSEHLLERLARACVAGRAAVAALQRGALWATAATAVRIAVSAALGRVPILCRKKVSLPQAVKIF